MELKATLAIPALLAQAQTEKTKVTLHLRSGTTLTGRVAEVGDHHVVIAELAGKELFDALVRTDEIAAIEVRVRGHK